jgi:hypothetical protein
VNLTLCSFLKFLHVLLLAVVAVGFNTSYGIWLACAAKEPEHAPHFLRVSRSSTIGSRTRAYELLLML